MDWLEFGRVAYECRAFPSGAESPLASTARELSASCLEHGGAFLMAALGVQIRVRSRDVCTGRV